MLKVYGFPRSGNNLLASYIANSFYPEQDTALRNLMWGHWSSRKHREVNPYGKCLGGHLHWPEHGVYVFRDPVDVAYSVWRSPGMTNPRDKRSFSEFIRSPIDWKFSPSQRYSGTNTVIENLHEHRMKSRGKGVPVRYRSLVLAPLGVMRYIEDQTGTPLQQFNKITEPVGYSPNVGKEKQIPDEDAAYIRRVWKNLEISI